MAQGRHRCIAAGRRHSITSSARARSEAGIARPRALAVLRLIASSNLVGCSIGSSAGLAVPAQNSRRQGLCHRHAVKLGRVAAANATAVGSTGRRNDCRSACRAGGGYLRTISERSMRTSMRALLSNMRIFVPFRSLRRPYVLAALEPVTRQKCPFLTSLRALEWRPRQDSNLRPTA